MFTVTRPMCLAVLFISTAILSSVNVSRANDTRMAFLSNSEKEQAPAIVDVPTVPSVPEVNSYDGRWIFTGAGCSGAGSVSAVIRAAR